MKENDYSSIINSFYIYAIIVNLYGIYSSFVTKNKKLYFINKLIYSYYIYFEICYYFLLN